MTSTVNEAHITRSGAANRGTLHEQIVHLYESEADLLELPQVLFATVGYLVEADVVTYTEFHHASGSFRCLVSADDDPIRRSSAMEAYASHMHSHAFWSYDPEFFRDRALRNSDVFGEEQYPSLPIVQQALLPYGACHIIVIVMRQDGYVLSLAGHRVAGRAPFSEDERDNLQAFRAHVARAYRQAKQRTLAELAPAERLRFAFPELSQRQLDVAAWLAEGKSNEEIATILAIGIDTVKAHVKALLNKIGAESRLGAAILAYTAPPFGGMPPLWRMPVRAWDERGGARTPGGARQ